jgi:PIN domain nuclease of toxin-antitoxin system
VKLLLDTHAFLWFVAGDERLGRKARRVIEDDEAELYLSAVSVWEMAIKSSLGRLRLPAPLTDYLMEKVADGFRILPVEWPHAAAVETLPFHHRDPFDRLLVAQALIEDLTVVTGDAAFRAYGATVLW